MLDQKAHERRDEEQNKLRARLTGAILLFKVTTSQNKMSRPGGRRRGFALSKIML